jgi:hypothetical protein
MVRWRQVELDKSQLPVAAVKTDCVLVDNGNQPITLTLSAVSLLTKAWNSTLRSISALLDHLRAR